MSTVGVGRSQQVSDRYPHPHRLRLSAELLLVALAATAVYLLAQVPAVSSALPAAATHLVVFLATAGGAAAAAILAGEIARVTERQGEASRLAAMSAALGTYAIVVMPFSTALFAADGAGTSLWVGQLVAHFAMLVLLIVALFESRVRWLRSWQGLALAAVVTVGTAAASASWPWLTGVLIGSMWLHVAIFATWVAVAVGFCVDGVRRGHALTWRIGLGLVILNASQLAWMFSEPPNSATTYVVPALQALGIGGIVIALGWRLRVVVAAVRRHQREEAEQARASLEALLATQERTAVRDHEIRNLVAGLSGVSYLLDQSSAPGDARELGAALEAELGRLGGLVDGDTGAETDHAQVGAVLRRLVMLHRANGMRIELATEPGLAASIRPSALTQVLANVLSNCARHAPGAAVHIEACHTDHGPRIDVHDDGPGVPSTDFNPSSMGSGLGLSECCELLDADNSAIHLGSSDRLAGALVTLELRPAEVLEPR